MVNATPQLVAVPTENPTRSGRSRRRRKYPFSVIIGFSVVALLVLAAVLAPLVAPHDPNRLDFGQRLLAPSLEHPMGTDDSGRDVLSRVIYGLRLDLSIAAAITFGPLPVGMLLGAVAGYRGGLLDTVVSRVVEVILSFPFLVLIIAIIGMVGPGLKGVLIGVPIVGWAIYTRMARADMLLIRELPYMQACTALGFSKTRSVLRHGVPNLMRNCLVFSTVDLVANMLLLAGVAYLGLGAQPPTPELGSIIASGQAQIMTAWWVVTLPALVLVTFGVAVGVIGESLSDGRLSGLAE